MQSNRMKILLAMAQATLAGAGTLEYSPTGRIRPRRVRTGMLSSGGIADTLRHTRAVGWHCPEKLAKSIAKRERKNRRRLVDHLSREANYYAA